MPYARLWYSLNACYTECSGQSTGDRRHAQVVMNELAEAQHFKIIDAQPESIADGWQFWIEYPDGGFPALPHWITRARWDKEDDKRMELIKNRRGER